MSETGRIFISYRREETAFPAGWLFDRLVAQLGQDQVFKDVDSIQLGEDFVEVITAAVARCDVLLALIGEQWLTITGEDGQRRLDDPHDFVRLEIEAALARNVLVIPILVEARMPRAAELPSSMAKLAHRQALELSPARFNLDTNRLLRVLDKTLAEVRSAQEDMATPSEQAAQAEQALGPTSAELRETQEEGGRAKPAPMPSVPPGAPSMDREVLREGPQVSEPKPRTGETEPPPEEARPRDKLRHRVSRRAWILASAGVALILLAIVFVANVVQGRDIVFEDDFSNQKAGWTVSENINAGSGSYSSGALTITAQPGDEYGAVVVPRTASSLYPVAPPSINIKVDTRLIDPSVPTQYGIACRVGADEDSGYAFIVHGEHASIEKINRNSGLEQPLRTRSAQVDLYGKNELSATCESNEEQTSVHLRLAVNGVQVVQYTDITSPLPNGTVALGAAGAHALKTSRIQVQFDNFVVTHV